MLLLICAGVDQQKKEHEHFELKMGLRGTQPEQIGRQIEALALKRCSKGPNWGMTHSTARDYSLLLTATPSRGSSSLDQVSESSPATGCCTSRAPAHSQECLRGRTHRAIELLHCGGESPERYLHLAGPGAGRSSPSCKATPLRT